MIIKIRNLLKWPFKSFFTKEKAKVIPLININKPSVMAMHLSRLSSFQEPTGDELIYVTKSWPNWYKDAETQWDEDLEEELDLNKKD